MNRKEDLWFFGFLVLDTLNQATKKGIVLIDTWN